MRFIAYHPPHLTPRSNVLRGASSFHADPHIRLPMARTTVWPQSAATSNFAERTLVGTSVMTPDIHPQVADPGPESQP